MAPESEFLGRTYKPPRKTRRMRKNYTVTVLTAVKARGRYRKHEGFNRGLRGPQRVEYVPPPARL